MRSDGATSAKTTRWRSSIVVPGSGGKSALNVGLNPLSGSMVSLKPNMATSPGSGSEYQAPDDGAKSWIPRCNRLLWYISMKFSIMIFQLNGTSGIVTGSTVTSDSTA